MAGPKTPTSCVFDAADDVVCLTARSASSGGHLFFWGAPQGRRKTIQDERRVRCIEHITASSSSSSSTPRPQQARRLVAASSSRAAAAAASVGGEKGARTGPRGGRR